MNQTRAYTLAELDLLPPSVLLDMVLKNGIKKCPLTAQGYERKAGSLVLHMYHGAPVELPIRSYAAAVVEHNKNTQEVVDLVKYNSQFNTLSFYKKNLKIGGWDTLSTMYHTTNPFQGLTNPDGTQRTSCTREELDAWKRGEVV